eukprot:scaffold8474_cov258-Pinguiococcus_pyrenoidosus.AAC.3
MLDTLAQPYGIETCFITRNPGVRLSPRLFPRGPLAEGSPRCNTHPATGNSDVHSHWRRPFSYLHSLLCRNRKAGPTRHEYRS